jgi:hypothetical protein
VCLGSQGQDAQRVKDFLMEHTPHVVAVGAGSLEARQLKSDLDSIRDSILETNARVMTGQETGTRINSLSYLPSPTPASLHSCTHAHATLLVNPARTQHLKSPVNLITLLASRNNL